jgi:YegS/Rv2252/BmrU family lipid kinase
MHVTSSQKTLHRLSRLITAFLAQMRHEPAPVENPVSESVKQPGTYDQSNASTDTNLTQVASETTIDQDALPHQDLEPAISSVAAEYDDGRTKETYVSGQRPQGRLSGESAAEYTKRNLLRPKKAYLIINPRAGHNFTRVADVLAVLSAAGWKTGIAVKQYGGHATELATRAAEQDYDLIIAYGGDGTISHVVNGVMGAKGKGQRKIIGVIPGGTANQWAAETSVPVDPVKAALALIDSNVRTVDLGRIQVQEIKFPNLTQESQQQQQKGQKARKSKAKQPPGRENYFLLTAGLGIDAAVISHTSKGLKQQVGRFAYDLAAAESLPERHPFPIEVTIVENGQDQPTTWSGEAYQVILGNTRRYADVLELTPDAVLDDGKLDLCVITEGNAITTLQQISSLLFRHRPDKVTAMHFLAAHFLITVPASIHLQLDGSAVQLEDYLSKSDRKALQQEPDSAQVMVSYSFDALPHALRVAIPETYDNTLFEHLNEREETDTADEQQPAKATSEQRDGQQEEVQRESSDLVNTLLEHGYKITIAGVVAAPGKRHRYVIAGQTVEQQTGEPKPVAIRIDEDTSVLLHTGEHVPHDHVLKLQDSAEVIAVGKESKRGVIKAKHMILPS